MLNAEKTNLIKSKSGKIIKLKKKIKLQKLEVYAAN